VSRRWIAVVILMIVSLQTLAALAADFKVPPTPDHFVTDNAEALSATTRGSLEDKLQRYERSTGHQVIVWIGQTTGDVPLETWTVETADHWKVGRRGHDDGAVLFIFMQDHKARIEVGYGLESSLTDADSYRIIQNVIVPLMRSGDVDGAVSSGVAAMLTTITPSYAAVTPPPEAAQDNGNSAFMWLIIAIVILSILVPIVIQLLVFWKVGHLITSRGSRGAFFGGFSGFSGGGGFGGGSFGGGFSAGGGGFGGGGASGGW
jgi:uncharacterized protein